MPSTILQQLNFATKTLINADITQARLDAEILLSHVLKKPKEFLYTHPEYVLTERQSLAFKKVLDRRLELEPIAYIINKKEFYGYEFYIDKRVLIPRPKTEELVEKALDLVDKQYKQPNTNFYLIDVGTGSGCIIISLVKELLRYSPTNKITFFAADISSKALEVAKINAKKHKVNQFIKFYQGNLLEPILNNFTTKKSPYGDSTIIITANLPYITPAVYKTLAPEITQYEPKEALLTENEDPCFYYRKLDEQIERIKKSFEGLIYTLYEKSDSDNF